MHFTVDAFPPTSSEVLNAVLDSIGNILNIGGGQAGNRDTSVGGHIDVMLVDHLLALLGSEADE